MSEHCKNHIRMVATCQACHNAMNRMTGVELIAAERKRQIEVEGWTSEDDDQNIQYELSTAGSCYAVWARFGSRCYPTGDPPPHHWPWQWSKQQWKPSPDPIRNLVKAGALIAAEIDRLQREAGNHVNP